MRNSKKFGELLFNLVAKFGENGVVETKLMKLLYFSEADFYKSNLETISGVNYYKNHFGPTPDIKIFEKSLKDLSSFIKKEKAVSNDRTITLFKVKNKNYPYKNLTEQHMEVCDRIYKLYGELNSDNLSKLSHLDPPYLAAKPKEKIDFSFVLYRKNEEGDVEQPISKEEREKFRQALAEDSIVKLLNYAETVS